MTSSNAVHRALVVTDHIDNGDGTFTLTVPSAQLLTLARGLGLELDVLALNPAPDTAALGRLGVSRVWAADLAGASPRVSAVVVDAARAALDAIGGARLVFTVSNHRGREIAARLSALTGLPSVVDAAEVSVDDSRVLVSKGALAGAWTSRVSAGEGVIVALRPSSVAAEDAEVSTTPEVHPLPVSLSPEAAAVRVVSSTRQSTEGPSLTEASVVVVGGRGTDGDFAPVEELAAVLGGAVGATRVASDEGWVPRSIQIGQTGVTVSPDLYVGLGVSGAIHHTVGMQSARRIVAVCDDPDAPIFELADFGVVGDLFEVVPQAVAALRAARGE